MKTRHGAYRKVWRIVWVIIYTSNSLPSSCVSRRMRWPRSRAEMEEISYIDAALRCRNRKELWCHGGVGLYLAAQTSGCIIGRE